MAPHDPGDRPQQGHLAALDSLRGITAVGIIAFHMFRMSRTPGLGNSNAADALEGAFLGVDVFFVLSGFVLFLPIARRGGDSGRYSAFLVRRVTRLWPVYALALTAAYAAHGLRGVPLSQLPPANGGWGVIASNLFLVPTLTGTLGVGLLVDTVVWTVAVEMCFSIVLPLVARWYFRHPALGLATAFLISRGWDEVMERAVIPRLYPAAAGAPPPSASYTWVAELPGYATHFALGMTLAWVFVRHGDMLRERAGALGIGVAIVAGTVGLLCTCVLLGRYAAEHPGTLAQWSGTWPVLLPLTPLVLGLALAQGRVGRLLGWAPLSLLGTIAYPLYLIHLPVLQTVGRHLSVRGWQEFGLLALAVPPLLVASWVISRLVEQPALDAGRRFAQRMNSRAAAATDRQARSLPEPAR